MALVAPPDVSGVGRTATAIEYAYRSRQDDRYTLTWWIRGDTTLTLLHDLAALAPVLDVPATANLLGTARRVRTPSSDTIAGC